MEENDELFRRVVAVTLRYIGEEDRLQKIMAHLPAEAKPYVIWALLQLDGYQNAEEMFSTVYSFNITKYLPAKLPPNLPQQVKTRIKRLQNTM